MIRLQPLAVCLALAATSPSASAQYLGSRFSYDFIELDYRMTEFDLAGEPLDGYFAHISIESTKNIRVMARWGDSTGSVDGLDASRRDLELGLGFYQSVNRQVDSTFDVKFLRSESEGAGTRSTDTGYGLEGGMRWLPYEYVELAGSLEFRDLVKTEVGGRVGALLHFNRHVALTGGLTYFSEQQSLHAGIRFSL